jgi:hypothetical protein
MYALRHNGGRLYRFIAEQILGITLTTAPAAFLVMTGMIALAIVTFACSSPTATEPIHERETLPLTPTNTPTPTATPTPQPTPTLLPPVTLEEPEDGSCLACGSEARPCWSCTYDLQPGELYRLEVYAAKENYPRFYYTTEDYYSLTNLSPGEYDWGVDIVRSSRRKYEQVSGESARYHFEIVPPPVVHNISPTCTVQGTGVTVVVSGENFTHSVALTIGVPVEVAFGDSSTITATIPITLEIGEYPVIVEGSTDGDVSSVFFAVNERPKDGGPVKCAPWNPATPIPSAAPPGYDPYAACIVECCAPAPKLVGPEDGAEPRFGTPVELKWTWDYCLPPGWQFGVRISAAYPPHSYRYEDNPKLISCENGKAIGRYPLPEDSRCRHTPGTCYWNIAVVRSLGNDKWERLSEESEIRSFTVQEREKDKETDW